MAEAKRETGYTERIQEVTERDVGDINVALMFRDLPIGARVKLRKEVIGEVIGNPGDGGWLFVKIVEAPSDAAQVGSEEMVFCADVLGMA